MNVCLLNDSFPPVIDGVANVVMNYAKIMQEEGLANVIVGTPEYPGVDYSGYSYGVVPYKSINTTRLVNGYRTGYPLAVEEIASMEAFEPDIIHSHCPFSSTVVARLLRAKTKVPLVFTYHTKFDVDIAKAVKARMIQKETIKAIVKNIEACDEVWVVSKGAGENLASLGYLGEYRVVNNGVDFAKGRVSDAEVARVTKGYDLPADVPVFLFVGRIVKYKGIPLILEAMARLAGRGNDVRMVFVGSGPDEEELMEQARQLGLLDPEHNKCIFVEAIHDREQLRAWNTRADLFLFPSTYDTNGIVVREAAACGLASVLIQDSCAAEGIRHGRNGYLIEETQDSMCALLEEVCHHLQQAHQVGQHAMDEIYISWKESVYQANKRYEEILELKNRGRLQSKRSVHKDVFVDYSLNFLEGAETVLKFPKRLYLGVHDSFEEMSEFYRIGELVSEWKDELKKKMSENSWKQKMDYKQAAMHWKELDRESVKEEPTLLKKEIEAYIQENSTCALATGYGYYVRCTPIEYTYQEEAFWMFSEGGEKFVGLEKNENVCLAIFDKYEGFGNLKGMQIMGVAQMIEPFTKEYLKAAEFKKIPVETLKKLSKPMNLIKVIPKDIIFLNSEFTKEGYSSRQTLHCSIEDQS